MKSNFKSILFLLCAAMIWGFAFVAQDAASEHLGNFSINGFRSIIAFISIMIILLIKKITKKVKIFPESKQDRKVLWFVSALCGICFAVAYNLQQKGLAMYPDGVASSGRAGFLTGLYVVFVPIIGFIFFKKKIGLNNILSVILAFIGLYLLCFGDGFEKIYLGDFVLLPCSIFFALQIIIVGKYSDRIEPLIFCALQLLICGIISLVFAIPIEKPEIGNIVKAIFPLIFLGVFSCGVADLLQVYGQSLSNNPTVDSIIMSLESVFAVIGGLIFLGQIPDVKEIIGCVIMFSAIILSQIEIKLKKTLPSE